MLVEKVFFKVISLKKSINILALAAELFSSSDDDDNEQEESVETCLLVLKLLESLFLCFSCGGKFDFRLDFFEIALEKINKDKHLDIQLKNIHI